MRENGVNAGMRQRFAEVTGAKLLPEQFKTNDAILLSHGDEFCIDDTAYQQMRTLFRSAAWQDDILSKTLDERKALGEGLRAQSRMANSNKASNIMDVNQEAVASALSAHQVEILIHGHTHRPGVHRESAHHRYVLGAWERCGWVLRQHVSTLQLECFSLARHYGT